MSSLSSKCADPRNEFIVKEMNSRIEACSDHMRFVYMKCIKSIKKYPIQLTSGHQARRELNGIGGKMEKIVDKIIKKNTGGGLQPAGVPLDPSTPSECAPPVAQPVNEVKRKPKKRKKNQDENFLYRVPEAELPDDLPAGIKVAPNFTTANYNPDRSAPRQLLAINADLLKLTVPALKMNIKALQTKEKVGGTRDQLIHRFKEALKKPVNAGFQLLEGSIKTVKPYIPKEHSGGWALLVVLTKATDSPGFKGHLKIKELKDSAKAYCSEPFESNYKEHYSAWSSMSTLIKKDLVKKWSNPSKYCLTVSGYRLGSRIAKNAVTVANSRASHPARPGAVPRRQTHYHPGQSLNARRQACEEKILMVHHNTKVSSTQKQEPLETLLAPLKKFKRMKLNALDLPPIPGGYEVVLLLDNRELKSRRNPTFLPNNLRMMRIPVEVMALPLGDALWIARPISSQDQTKWIILGYIIERKVLADLCDSIKSGRFEDQRTRLCKSGMENVTYLIEGSIAQRNAGLFGKLNVGVASLSSAIANLDMIYGFNIHRTRDCHDTVWSLGIMTRTIARLVAGDPTRLRKPENSRIPCPLPDIEDVEIARGEAYSQWKKRAKKTTDIDRTLGLTFGLQLRMIGGNSADKVSAILDKYPTCHALNQAYEGCWCEEQEKRLLADLRFGTSNRTLGVSQSEKIRNFFRLKDYASHEAGPEVC